MEDFLVLGDPDDSAIHEKRLEQKKAEMAKSLDVAVKRVHALQEQALRMNLQI